MNDFTYLETDKDDYEKLSNSIDSNHSINFFNDDLIDLNEQFHEKDDIEIYKKIIEFKETGQTENEEELNYSKSECHNQEENLINIIEYIPEKKNIDKNEEKKSKRGRKKKKREICF